MNKLFVGNIPIAKSEGDLKSAFSKYPSICSAKLITDRETRQSRGFGFVEFKDAAEATRAIKEMNGAMMDGCMLKVNEAKPPAERKFGSGDVYRFSR